MSYKPWTDLNKITGASFKRRITPTPLKEVTSDFNYVGLSNILRSLLAWPCMSNFRLTSSGMVFLVFI